MPKLNIFNQAGEIVGNIEVSDYVFGIAPHQQALYDVAVAQRAAMRQGTSKTKTRTEVRGGGKKPWRQKGTGRARQGSIRSPQWRGGGTVFGPIPRKYNVKINKKVRNLAFRSALSLFVSENRFFVLEDLVMNGKTKEFQAMLNNLNIDGAKTIVVGKELVDSIVRAGRNIPTVELTTTNHLSVLDVLRNRNIVMTKDAVKAIEEALGNE